MRDDDRSELESAIKRLAAHGLTRRQALTVLVASGAGIAVSPLMSKLAWAGEGASKIPLARPNNPVKLPMHGKPIEDGLKPESGTFHVYNYADYLSKEILNKFGEKYDVDVRLTTFGNQEQAISRLANRDVDVDVTELLSDKVA